MDIDDLAKLVEKKHGETQDDIKKLSGKVDNLALSQKAVETKLAENVTTRVGCLQAQQKCKDEIHSAIRRVGMYNKIGSGLATVAAALSAVALWIVGKK